MFFKEISGIDEPGKDTALDSKATMPHSKDFHRIGSIELIPHKDDIPDTRPDNTKQQ